MKTISYQLQYLSRSTLRKFIEFILFTEFASRRIKDDKYC